MGNKNRKQVHAYNPDETERYVGLNPVQLQCTDDFQPTLRSSACKAQMQHVPEELQSGELQPEATHRRPLASLEVGKDHYQPQMLQVHRRPACRDRMRHVPQDEGSGGLFKGPAQEAR